MRKLYDKTIALQMCDTLIARQTPLAVTNTVTVTNQEPPILLQLLFASVQ